jgi:hypothetical protein
MMMCDTGEGERGFVVLSVIRRHQGSCDVCFPRFSDVVANKDFHKWFDDAERLEIQLSLPNLQREKGRRKH